MLELMLDDILYLDDIPYLWVLILVKFSELEKLLLFESPNNNIGSM